MKTKRFVLENSWYFSTLNCIFNAKIRVILVIMPLDIDPYLMARNRVFPLIEDLLNSSLMSSPGVAV